MLLLLLSVILLLFSIYIRTVYYKRFSLPDVYRLSREYLLQLLFPCVFPVSIPLGPRMNQVIAWRSNETNDNFFLLSVMHFIFLTFFQLNILILVRVIKEMSTLMQHTGEKNHTQQIREVFKFNIILLDNCDILAKIQGGKVDNN